MQVPFSQILGEKSPLKLPDLPDLELLEAPAASKNALKAHGNTETTAEDETEKFFDSMEG